MGDAELAADVLHLHGAAFVDEGRIPGDHEQVGKARQFGDDLVDHAVAEVFLLGVAAHVGEWQNRYRRLVGQRRCRAMARRIHGACGGGPAPHA